MTEQFSDRAGLPNFLAGVKEYLPTRLRRDIPVVPVVRLSGTIGAITPLRPGLSLVGVARTLERAFSMRNARAVALVVNSPGGAPVQSSTLTFLNRTLVMACFLLHPA